MTKPSTADLFFAAAQPRSEPFEMPGVGEVQVMELKEADVALIRKRIETESDTARRSKIFGLGLVVRSVHKDGARVFVEADIDRFAEVGNSAVERLAGAVLKVNGYGADLGN